ncbi:MAG TPA: sugar ABC transporter ATP-binding protein, partial [Bacteroidota bacterium]|nr:sugar ABC transporter ATP-binding protein [Bacteroidota bacterium]
MTPSPVLRMQDISKEYPGVLALNRVSFDLFPGEVHCLVGENGAGKSTLVKILSGAVALDSGEIVLDGKSIRTESPSASRNLGISVIHQEFQLVPDMNVAENILLGNEPTRYASLVVDTKTLHARARAILAQLGERIDSHELVRNLPTAKRQIVEIAKALSRSVRILVMDEPTSTLTGNETANLFTMIRRLKSGGMSVIYISHRLEEIFAIGDRVTVLRDGETVSTTPVNGVTTTALIRWMVGRELENEFPGISMSMSDEILRVDHLSTSFLRDVSFTLHKGEILGIAGLVGAGRTEIARALFGTVARSGGAIRLLGERYEPASPADAIRAGLGLLTEDRNNEGLLPGMSVRENISISNLANLATFAFIHASGERRIAEDFVRHLRIKTPSTETDVGALSGGNRQKVVLGRWLCTSSKLLIFDEPTVGIDVGAKYEIYQRIRQLARDGVGIIVISSDMPELLGLCTRFVVLCAGRHTGTLMKEEATQERILSLATRF